MFAKRLSFPMKIYKDEHKHLQIMIRQNIYVNKDTFFQNCVDYTHLHSNRELSKEEVIVTAKNAN